MPANCAIPRGQQRADCSRTTMKDNTPPCSQRATMHSAVATGDLAVDTASSSAAPAPVPRLPISQQWLMTATKKRTIHLIESDDSFALRIQTSEPMMLRELIARSKDWPPRKRKACAGTKSTAHKCFAAHSCPHNSPWTLPAHRGCPARRLHAPLCLSARACRSYS